jgi:ACS family tartrate transporter-like MFS transporter
LTNAQFGVAAGVFFIGYCLLEVPSNLALYRFGARRWLARIMVSWGLLSAACALVAGPTSLYLLRMLAGAAEAGFFPGVLFYLSCWFPAQSRLRVLAWFLVAIPLSSAVGAPLSVAIMTMDGLGGLRGWQWLFLLEGMPACVMGFFTLLLLRDTPQDATWLTTGERQALMQALAQEGARIPPKNFAAAVRNGKVWLLIGILFSYWIGINGVAMWLPLILKGQGRSEMAIGFLASLPYLIASVVMMLWARYMDQSGRHLLHLMAACLVAACGLTCAVAFDALAAALAGIVLAVVGLSAARPAFYSLPSRYLTGIAAAGGMALINATGSLGGYVGPWIVGLLRDRTGSFVAGMEAMSVMLVVAAVLTGVLMKVTGES